MNDVLYIIYYILYDLRGACTDFRQQYKWWNVTLSVFVHVQQSVSESLSHFPTSRHCRLHYPNLAPDLFYAILRESIIEAIAYPRSNNAIYLPLTMSFTHRRTIRLVQITDTPQAGNLSGGNLGRSAASTTREAIRAALSGAGPLSGITRRSAARPTEGEIMCSFAQNGEEFLEQHWYHCYTCGALT